MDCEQLVGSLGCLWVFSVNGKVVRNLSVRVSLSPPLPPLGVGLWETRCPHTPLRPRHAPTDAHPLGGCRSVLLPGSAASLDHGGNAGLERGLNFASDLSVNGQSLNFEEQFSWTWVFKTQSLAAPQRKPSRSHII